MTGHAILCRGVSIILTVNGSEVACSGAIAGHSNFGFGYVFLIGSMYEQNINFNQSIKQCLSASNKYAFLLKVISLWIKVDFAISWRKVKIWLTSTNVKF